MFIACIGEDTINDEVSPELRILNPIQNLSISGTYQYNANYFNNVGQSETTSIIWSSSNESVASIDGNGLVVGLSEGTTSIKAVVSLNNNIVEANSSLAVVMDAEETPIQSMKSGTIATTSSYSLTGSFTLAEVENSNNLLLSLSDNYQASTSLPGLYVYLTNNPNSIANARSLGPVSVFNGAHNYTIQDEGINNFSYLLYWCEPFGVKVGGGTIN